MGKVHQLKTVNPFFEAVWRGTKTAEIRYNDRDYKVGDLLELKEYDAETKTYIGRIIPVLVTHVLRADDIDLDNSGLREGFVMLSFRVVA
jgi:hypothetical protein